MLHVHGTTVYLLAIITSCCFFAEKIVWRKSGLSSAIFNGKSLRVDGDKTGFLLSEAFFLSLLTLEIRLYSRVNI